MTGTNRLLSILKTASVGVLLACTSASESGGRGAAGSPNTVSSGGGSGASAGASGGAPAVAGASGTPGGGSGNGVAGTGGNAGGGAGGGTGGADPNQRRLLLRDEGLSELHYVDLGNSANNWSVAVPAGRDMQLVGDDRVLIGTDNGYEVRAIADGSSLAALATYPGTLAAHRLHNQNTLLAGVNWQGEQGIVLVEVDASGGVVRQLVYEGFDYVRLVRETVGGHFLVTADNVVFEGTADGQIVWQVTVEGHAQPHAWEALRLASGNVVVATGYAASLQIFSPEETLLQTLTGGSDEVNPLFYADVQVLDNDHFVVVNWQGHGTTFGDSGLQLLEYDSAGALVWSWKQDASFVSSLQAAIVLDGLDLDKLHVENVENGVLEPID